MDNDNEPTPENDQCIETNANDLVQHDDWMKELKIALDLKNKN